MIATRSDELISYLKQFRREDIVTLQCPNCAKDFSKTRHRLMSKLNKYNRQTNIFCSKKCFEQHRNGKSLVECGNCAKPVEKLRHEIKSSLSGKVFCSRSCAVTYNNTHKKHGIRRSKLEIWLEKQLPLKYPTIKFHFNQKDAINSELDIYLPEYKLAFELNGIFHYEPIFGEGKLAQINNNDHRKFQACSENGIELCIIDVSSQKHFKPASSKRFLDIIINIIEKRLAH